MKRVAMLVATAGGAGYSPIAPGTVGSLVGVVIYFLTRGWPLVWQAALLGAISAAGIWAASVAARQLDREDPSQVVIDEVAGQLVTLFACGASWLGVLLGFLVFRVLDIIKPWPADRLERLHGGLGIVADDLMAGVYGAVILQVAVRLLPGVL
jgi:phosphatidylglycerophosphatase A